LENSNSIFAYSKWALDNQTIYDLSLNDREFALKFHKKLNQGQIRALLDRKKLLEISKTKLSFLKPSLASILAPPKLSLEQCSSEKTASYKAQLFSGKRMLDLTGGFGVDLMHFSSRFEKVQYNESNLDLALITQYNFDKLQFTNISVSNNLAENFTFENEYDLIFIDPDRRGEHNKKLVNLHELKPNLIELLPKMQQHSSKILIKLSPLLDLKSATITLSNISEIHLLLEKNELKEVLLLVDSNDSITDVQLFSVDLDKPDATFISSFTEEEACPAPTYGIARFLFEPNAAIMKSGAFKTLAVRNKLLKIAPNTHLYCSNTEIELKSGRVFEIIDKTSPFIKEIKPFLENQKANISIRNYPESVEEIRKKLKIKEGGDVYLFFCTDAKMKKIVLICRKFKTA
jgi:16S rRNA G966 N2-methylase RsmD